MGKAQEQALITENRQFIPFQRNQLMHRLILSFALLTSSGAVLADIESIKARAVESIDSQSGQLIELSDQIWAFAETALQEHQSAAVLADYAEAQGFEVSRGVAGMPTAFTARYGSGKPVIGIMGEYDALPGLSQQASAVKSPLEEGAAGHGCGHNLFGAASLGAAVAIKQHIASGSLQGTVIFFGTPAEESVSGKNYMIREGLFDGVDVALAWHPDYVIKADTASSQAMVEIRIQFEGQAAHAAYDPWNGRSALDALELTTFAINQLREHVKPSVRMHYTITGGGDVPNVIPEHAGLWLWLRDSSHDGVNELIGRVRKIVEGAAIATGTTGELNVITGTYEMLSNIAGARLIQRNFEWLGPMQFDQGEIDFARELQKATGKEQLGMNTTAEPFDDNPGEPEGGSTDVADVSWKVPTLQLLVATAPIATPWHAWPVVAAGGMSIGHKGMLYAAKSLAATMVDLYVDADARAAIHAEWLEDKGGRVYKPFLSDGPPPLPGQ
jgi:aminobenzoyl-glutamate utilization protein B